MFLLLAQLKKINKNQYKTVNKEMIGWGSLDQCGNMESLQRDGLARVKAVDALWLPVRQNKNTCFCTVSRPTIDLNFYPPPSPPKKKKKTLHRI